MTGGHYLRIVDSWAGANTGDVCYRTDDGRTWHTYRGGYIGTGEGEPHALSYGQLIPEPIGGERPTPRGPETNRHERRQSASPRKRKGMRGRL